MKLLEPWFETIFSEPWFENLNWEWSPHLLYLHNCRYPADNIPAALC